MSLNTLGRIVKSRLSACLLALGVVLGLLVVSPPAPAAPLPGSRGSAWLEALPAHQVFSSTADKNYRKAMASVLNADGSVDLWTCAKNSANSAPVITYRRSSNGTSWPSTELAVLTPTSGGRDSAGVCDPSVVQLGGYYYMAYSGWASPKRTMNDVFVARSRSAAGPFQKWNGNGWAPFGPQPVVSHVDQGYGAWAPSLVVKDGLLHLFYASTSPSGQQGTGPGTVTQMHLRVADVSGRSGATEMWPERLDYQGVAITLPGETKPDGTGSGAVPDIKYMDAFEEFIAVGAGDPYADSAHPTMWESRNGLSFGKALAIRGSWEQRAGDVELRGDERGHLIGKVDPGNFLSYTVSDPLGLAGRYDTYGAQLSLGYLAPVGAVHPPQAAEPGSWQVVQGTWRSIDGAYTSVDTSAGSSTLSTVLPDSVTAVMDIRYTKTVAGRQAVAGVNLGSGFHPNADHGYTVFLTPDGVVTLTKAAEGQDVTLASARTGWQPDTASQHLRIVKSHGTILVFVGPTKKPFIAYTDKDQPYTAGRLSLVTANASVAFSEISVSDNVPPRGYTADDWGGGVMGSWGINPAASECSQRSASGGWISLMDTTYAKLNNGEWAAGDGAYSVTVKLDPTQPDTKWAGINIANPKFGYYQTWSEPGNGYVVFLRGNGNVGLWKGGYGQVVPDVATPARPKVQPARLEVVKTGPNIQVFVDGSRQPSINYTDGAADASMAGAFLLTTDGVATFGSIAYAGNNLMP